MMPSHGAPFTGKSATPIANTRARLPGMLSCRSYPRYVNRNQPIVNRIATNASRVRNPIVVADRRLDSQKRLMMLKRIGLDPRGAVGDRVGALLTRYNWLAECVTCG